MQRYAEGENDRIGSTEGDPVIAVGGPSPNPSPDINDGAIIWLVPGLVANEDGPKYRLERGHWEVLTLEQSTAKLLAARPISRDAFETTLLSKLAAIRL